jgi:iron complex outermembrane receptor protein
VDRYNAVPIPRRQLWSAAVRLTPPRLPLSLAFDLKNLTDDRASDLAGYPLPGRALFVTLDWRLGPAGPDPLRGEEP